ncbi:MAG: DNA primase family protein [Verrucomicrobiales bacterium]
MRRRPAQNAKLHSSENGQTRPPSLPQPNFLMNTSTNLKKSKLQQTAEDLEAEANTAALKGKAPNEALRELLETVHEEDFQELAKSYLEKKLCDAEGKPRKPTQREASVIITDHFIYSLKARGSGLAIIDQLPHAFLGDHWLPLDKDSILRAMGTFAQKIGHRVSDARHHFFREDLLKQLHCVADTIQADESSIVVNFLNGTLRISDQGQELHPHRREDALTYVLPFDYEPEAECPMFDRFLDRVLPDEECRTVLMEFFGWIFLRDLKLEKMMILYGSGHNGKSVVFDIITALLSKSNVSNLGLSTLEDPKRRTPMLGKLLNYGSEIKGNLDPDLLKNISSGEPLEFRYLFKDNFTSSNFARLVFNANTLPTETECTDGFFRRFLIIPFEQTITEDEKDPELATKIIKHELAGVMMRVLAGMKRVQQARAFSPCRKADQYLKAYQMESDTVAQFLEDAGYQISTDAIQAKGEFYQEYKEYCIMNGFRPLGNKNFSQRLERHHRIPNGKSGSLRYWRLEKNNNI